MIKLTRIDTYSGSSLKIFLSKLAHLIYNRLARDFFSKLCAYPPSERYDAKMALSHPWITGVGGKAEIPLTRKQQL